MVHKKKTIKVLISLAYQVSTSLPISFDGMENLLVVVAVDIVLNKFLGTTNVIVLNVVSTDIYKAAKQLKKI